MNLRLLAEGLAARGTRFIGARWGETFPFYHVAGYPKSGTTWLARMVADYLELPFPQYSLLPASFACVIQTFGRYDPRLRRIFYLYRDGRDVLVSLYFDRLRVARQTSRPGSRYLARTYERLLGTNYDPRDIVQHLPRFLEFELDHPGRGSSLNWPDHVGDWLQGEGRGGMTLLSYEDLLKDTKGTLERAIRQITGVPADPWRLSMTVEKMSMKRQTGRERGQADPSQHVRKGVAGDWRLYFSREAAEIFRDRASKALVTLGYEEDDTWVERYECAVP